MLRHYRKTYFAGPHGRTSFGSYIFFFFQAEDGIRDLTVTGVQTCALPIWISCGATCLHGFDDGTVVTLTASPAAGSTFAGWSGGGCSGTSTTCQVTMQSNQIGRASCRERV